MAGGGAGHIFDMIARIKANRALRRKSGYFKSTPDPVDYSAGESLQFKTPTAEELREFSEKLDRDATQTRKKNFITIVLSFVVVAGAAWLLVAGMNALVTEAPIDEKAIHISRIEQHPFLPDHKKLLKIRSPEGDLIDQAEMYVDFGEGCNSYLFDTDKTFTLIECNGQWYEISKATGQISGSKWNWDKPLPANYLGTFQRVRGVDEYVLVKGTAVSPKEVYRYKDPIH